MNYHDQLIEFFCDNIGLYEADIGFSPTKIKKNLRIGNGDVDILLEDAISTVVVEVKSHSGLLQKFKMRQLQKYRSRFPKAEIYSFTGNTNKSLDPVDVRFEKH